MAIVFTKALFTSYESEKVMESYGNVYLLQYGSYINKVVMNENIKRLDDYIIYEDDNKYYVHVGVYTNLETAHKMQKIFKNKNIHTYIKNDYLGDNKIISEISKLDQLLLNEENNEKMFEINKKILNLFKNSIS